MATRILDLEAAEETIGTTWYEIRGNVVELVDALDKQALANHPLVALVAEWREAKKEWEACKPGPFPWSAGNKAKADRIDTAEAALAAWRP